MEENNVVEVDENSLLEAKSTTFHWAKFWAWASIVISLVIPLVGVGLGILSNSMTTEENKDEVMLISIVGMGIGAFLAVLDLVNQFLNLFY